MTEIWTPEQYRDHFSKNKKSKSKPKNVHWEKPKADSKSGKARPKIDIFCFAVKKQFGVEIVPEFRFHPVRKWRFDYAIPELKLAIEVEGGIWTQGRHTRGKGFLGDMEKYNQAAADGWTLYRTTPKDLMTAQTFDAIHRQIEKK